MRPAWVKLLSLAILTAFLLAFLNPFLAGTAVAALGPKVPAADFVGGPIIADHTVVDLYDDIPQYWIDEVKKMWINIPGESHSAAYRDGLVLLAAMDPDYPAVSTESGPPEPYTDQHLRVSRHVRNQYSNWSLGAGERQWYTWYAYPLASQPAEKDLIKNHITYCETNSLHIAAIGFGWCWDTTWHNSPGGTIDPVFNVRWAGSSDGGPEGDLRWGLDADDYTLTGNSVCMDTYLGATEDYRLFCETNSYSTAALFTTGPVDGYTGESGYQRYLKHEYIRDYVAADPDRVLFDYADILCYDDDGSQTTTTWDGHTYPVITPTNLGDGSVGHIGSAGAVRLAKATWWMLARLAGWDGTPAGAPVISGVQADYATNATVNITWTTNEPATSQVEYGPDAAYGSSTPLDGDLVYSHTVVITGLQPGSTYHFRVRSQDDLGTEAVSGDNTFETTYMRVGSSDYYGQWSNSLPTSEDFFPLAVWLQSPSNAGNYRDIGINTYVGLWEGPTESQLSELNAQGMYVVASQNAVGLTSPNNGIIKSWMHQDEPDNAQWNEETSSWGPCIAPGVLVDLFKGWKENDPTRPVLLNFGQGVANIGWYGRWYLNDIGGKDYSVESGNYSLYYTEASEGADIISFDIYPVTHPDAEIQGKLEYVAEGVKNLVSWSDGARQVWNCIETTHINSPTERPTPEQIRSEVWMSIISGSRGIIYFVHEWEPSFREDGIFRYPDAVAAVNEINSRITSLAPVLNSPTVSGEVQVTSAVPIDTLVKNYGGDTYLFAAAMQNVSTQATFDVSGIPYATVEVLGEGRQLTLEDGAFQDGFAGYGVHLYRITPADAPPPGPDEPTPPGPDEPYAYYLAEGYTGENFTEYICMANPGDTGIVTDITYLFPDGSDQHQSVSIPPETRVTICVNDVVGAGREVSARIECEQPVIVERPMYFSYSGAWTGGHDTVAADSASRNWYFAEGYTGPGFVEYICVLNPTDTAANLVFRFQTQEAGEQVREGYSVPAHSRATFCVNDVLGPGYQASLALESDREVVAERPCYFDYAGMAGNHWTGGHCVVGATSLADFYYLAEGTTRSGFEEWITIQNPDADSAISVHASYQFGPGQGDNIEKDYAVEAGKRATIFVPAEVGTEKDVSVALSSAAPFLAERPLYFRYTHLGADWTGGHCVIASPETGTEWFFAEGYTGEGFHTWICLQNPAAQDAAVEISYYTPSGPLQPRYVTVPARTRLTIFANEHAGGGLEISSRIRVTSGPGIVAERPSYFSYHGWDGGHDVVGHQSLGVRSQN